jgi:hypothetical protein
MDTAGSANAPLRPCAVGRTANTDRPPGNGGNTVPVIERFPVALTGIEQPAAASSSSPESQVSHEIRPSSGAAGTLCEPSADLCCPDPVAHGVGGSSSPCAGGLNRTIDVVTLGEPGGSCYSLAARITARERGVQRGNDSIHSSGGATSSIPRKRVKPTSRERPSADPTAYRRAAASDPARGLVRRRSACRDHRPSIGGVQNAPVRRQQAQRLRRDRRSRQDGLRRSAYRHWRNAPCPGERRRTS